jgi:hypothetical protein
VQRRGRREGPRRSRSARDVQPLTRVVGQTDERHLGALGEAPWFGPIAKIDNHIGEDGVVAAGFAIKAHAVFEVLPAAVEAGSDPALALFRGIGDPSRVAPRAEQHRGAALATGPRRQCSAIDRRAAPGVPHDVERAHQCAEALIVIGAEKLEIGARRAAADTEAQGLSDDHDAE